jgi:hypothetical protein
MNFTKPIETNRIDFGFAGCNPRPAQLYSLSLYFIALHRTLKCLYS